MAKHPPPEIKIGVELENLTQVLTSNKQREVRDSIKRAIFAQRRTIIYHEGRENQALKVG